MAVVRNLAAFNAEVDAFAKSLVPAQFLALHKRVAFDIGAGTIQDTPVDKGRLRGGWQTTIAKATEADNGRIDPTGNAAQAELSQVITGLKLGDVIFFQNNVEYASFIEDGTELIAPRRMLARNVERVLSVFGK